MAALEWQKAGFDAELGLDKHFYDRARKEGKQVQGLETAEYQISRFDGIPMDQQERLLASTVDDLDTEMANVSTLAQAWKQRRRCDDRTDRAGGHETRTGRCTNVCSSSATAIGCRSSRRSSAAPGRAFVVVGAAHLIGPDGLIAMLKAKGYQLEQCEPPARSAAFACSSPAPASPDSPPLTT